MCEREGSKSHIYFVTRSRQLDLSLDIQLELFATLIMPILTYGSEVWVSKISNHLNNLKYILEVKMSTLTFIVRDATCKYCD